MSGHKKIDMKKLGFAFILPIVAIVFLGLAACSGGNKQQQLEKVAQRIDATCPQMLDAVSRLDKVEALPGLVIKSSATLMGIDKASFDAYVSEDSGFLGMMKQQMVEFTRADRGSAEVRRLDATLVYSFNDEAGENLFEITITPEEYK